jgi:predicted MPP superfamily phosphohydrolase
MLSKCPAWCVDGALAGVGLERDDVLAKRTVSQFDLARDFKRRHLERIIFRHPNLGKAIKCAGRCGLSLLIWPRFIAPFRWHLRHLEARLPNLPPEFIGFKILHLTDLHAGMTRTDYLVRSLKKALEHKPDLIAITGDFIDYRPEALPALDAILPLLKAPHGVWAVFGNHDYHEYSWRHVGERSSHRVIHRRLRKKLSAAGVGVLCNQSTAVRRKNAVLHLVGLDELWTGRSNPKQAFAGIDPSSTVICLQHNPDAIEALSAYHWDWMLCGHTHGGQVHLPLLGPLFVPVVHRQYLRGIFDLPPAAATGHRRFALVSTGIGYGLPVRWFVQPESIMITLQRGDPGYRWQE